ncbi:MAG: hypothetical protein PHI40_08365, partial [Caldisericia bacterium]|nr:hypothetical protein [Caldisericia bacterium]
IKANESNINAMVDKSYATLTALIPQLGLALHGIMPKVDMQTIWMWNTFFPTPEILMLALLFPVRSIR